MQKDKAIVPRLLFFASLFTAVFWVVANLFNVDEVSLVGVIFELLWLPMLAGMFVLPIVCVFFLLKEKFHLRSFLRTPY